MFCRNCGKELSDAARFCPGCGTKVGTAPVMAAEQKTEEAKTEEVKTEEAKTVQEAPAPAKEMPQNTAAPVKVEQGKNGKLGMIIFLIIILLLLAGAAAALFFFFTGDSYNIRKNRKLAEQCFAQEEYQDALSYYKAVLDVDPALTDVYITVADIYLMDDEYEAAVEFLNKGLKKNKNDEEISKTLSDKIADIYQEAAKHYAKEKNYAAAYEMIQNAIDFTGDNSLKAKKAEYYLLEADAYLMNGDDGQALLVLEAGLSDTGDESLLKRRVEIYKDRAQFLQGERDYETALELLDEGYRSTGDVSLQECMTEVYKAWAEDYLPNKEYRYAREILDKGLEKTGDKSLAERKTELYLQELNDVLETGDYLAALAFAEREAENTGESALAERAEYLRGHIRIKSRTAYDSDYEVLDIREYLLDKNGNPQSLDLFTSEGVLYEHRELDPEGNVTGRAVFDEDGNELEAYKTEYGYDDAGNMTKRIAYDNEGNIMEWTEWELDSHGTPVVMVTYDADENVLYVEQQECVYNDKGELTDYTVYQSKDLDDETKEIIEQGSYSYRYDDKGNLSCKVRYYEDGSIRDYTEYNEDGHVVSLCEYLAGDSYEVGEGSKVRERTYRYDPLGYLTEEQGKKYEDGSDYPDYHYYYEYEYQYVGE